MAPLKELLHRDHRDLRGLDRFHLATKFLRGDEHLGRRFGGVKNVVSQDGNP